MLKPLSNLVSNVSEADISSLIANIDLQKIKSEANTELDICIKALPENTQKETLEWFGKINSIKNDGNTSVDYKKEQIRKLEPSELILTFIEEVLHILIKKPESKTTQDILSSGLGLLKTASEYIDIPNTKITKKLYMAALPNLILTHKFDELAQYLIEKLNSAKMS